MSEIDVRPFGPETEADAIGVVNRYIDGWPFCRKIDSRLVSQWGSCGPAYQPQNMLVAYRDGTAAAFLHAESHGSQFSIHLLAAIPGAAAESDALLAAAEAGARSTGSGRLCGPYHRAAAFYGGYVLGREPYHPSWAAEVTDAFVRAGFRISHPGVLMALDGDRPIDMRPVPPGYEVVELESSPESGAVTFGCGARYGGEEASHCYARLYPELRDASGMPVGQIGHVGTVEAHRSRGLAAALVGLAVGRLRNMGAGSMIIATGLDNFAALRAYERVGFERRHNINEWSKELGDQTQGR